MLTKISCPYVGSSDAENVHNGQESYGNPGVLPATGGKKIRRGFLEV
jgi:hypothetical protein